MGETKVIDSRFREIEDLKKRLNNTMEQCRSMQTSNLELRRENESLNKRIEELKLENGAIMRERWILQMPFIVNNLKQLSIKVLVRHSSFA